MGIVNENYQKSFLPSNLKHLRKQMKISQEELAGMIGLNRGNIASYENGSAEPKICNLLKLGHLFGVSILALTQIDLTQAAHNGEETAPAVDLTHRYAVEDPLISQFTNRANELEAVMHGLNTCFCYKTKKLGEEIPKDMQVLLLHFEELYQAAVLLAEEHQKLLEFLQTNRKKV